MKLVFALFAFIATTQAAGILPFLSFDGGNVGVNFGGYSASAGLGGLLSGDLTRGGLHAEANTPFGQAAGAGLGGALSGGGGAGGGLYAGATAGHGTAAAAELGGITGRSGTFGGSSAGAIAGGHVGKFVSSEKHVVSAGPAVETLETVEEVHPKAQKTYIERTVIPNYVEKTVRVPSYVERTVKVPTFVEQTVRVPAEPTIVEKTVKHEEVDVNHVQPIVHKHIVHNKVIGTEPLLYGGGYGGIFSRGGFVGTGGEADGEIYVRKYGGYPGFYDNIFNIPISTLGAVNQFLNGLSGGGAVSGGFSKSVGFAAGKK